jgi:hypothetical protein
VVEFIPTKKMVLNVPLYDWPTLLGTSPFCNWNGIP